MGSEVRALGLYIRGIIIRVFRLSGPILRDHETTLR